MLPDPPAARRRPHTLETHGDVRVDDWYWLRDREDPEVLSYLEAENAYSEQVLAHTEPVQDMLYDEIVGRIQETDMSVPARRGSWWYSTRTYEGRQYAVHVRARSAAGHDEETVLDENELAAGQDYFSLGLLAVTRDGSLAAYGTDVRGQERYTLRFRDLTSKSDLPDVIEEVAGDGAWAGDGVTFFYVRQNEMERPWQVWRHTLGAPADDDVLVYQEDDERFFVGVGRTRSGRFVIVHVGSKITSEAWFVPADDPTAPLQVVEPRREGVEYDVSHHGDRFFIVTNDEAFNFRLVEAPVGAPGRANWRDVIPHRPDVKLDGVDEFERHLVLFERADGTTRLSVCDLETGDTHVVAQDEDVYTVHAGTNFEFDDSTYRYGYTSLVTPRSVFEYDVVRQERRLLKQDPVLGGYDASVYETYREWATAADGTKVPVSVVHRRGLARDGSNPCLLYGYGSYEISIDPGFSSLRLSLLERGFVFAIGHPRGGGEMGRRWYDEGKLLAKRNTFTDFVACAERLVELGLTTPSRLAIRGGSAGGLLMGATVNLRPDLFRAVVAQVPFVDVLTTILDESLPLTVTEWEEWGNPYEPEVYRYMKSYSPYDNVAAVDYPALYVTAGLNDPRVSYWEPAKWVAKLRATKTDDEVLVLRTEMGAGHFGPSGRYEAWRDEARVYAFLLDVLSVPAEVGRQHPR